MQHDHELVGQLIKREQEAEYASLVAFANDLGISRATVYRLFAGDPTVKTRTLRRAERILDLPHGILDAVREHDVSALKDSDLRPEVLTWLLREMGVDIRGGSTRNRQAK